MSTLELTTATPDEITEAIKGAKTEKDAEKIAKGLLPTPPQGIWYLLLGGLFVLACAFGVLSFMLIADGKSAEALVGLATGALGGVLGLLAPSPIAKD